MNVYDAASLSAVVQLSVQSVARQSAPVDFPDFTRGRWKTTAAAADRAHVRCAPMTRRAVVLARGLGTRMRAARSDAAAHAEQRAAADAGLKTMIPVNGRPFLDYVLSALADAGITDVGARGRARSRADARVLRARSRRRRASRIGFVVQAAAARHRRTRSWPPKRWAGGEPFLAMNADNLYPAAALRTLAGARRAGPAGLRSRRSDRVEQHPGRAHPRVRDRRGRRRRISDGASSKSRRRGDDANARAGIDQHELLAFRRSGSSTPVATCRDRPAASSSCPKPSALRSRRGVHVPGGAGARTRARSLPPRRCGRRRSGGWPDRRRGHDGADARGGARRARPRSGGEPRKGVRCSSASSPASTRRPAPMPDHAWWVPGPARGLRQAHRLRRRPDAGVRGARTGFARRGAPRATDGASTWSTMHARRSAADPAVRQTRDLHRLAPLRRGRRRGGSPRNFPGAPLGADIVFASDLPRASGHEQLERAGGGDRGGAGALAGIEARPEWQREHSRHASISPATARASRTG